MPTTSTDRTDRTENKRSWHAAHRGLRRVAAVIALIATAPMLVSACRSSSDTAAPGTTEPRTTAGAKSNDGDSLAAITGTWTSVYGNPMRFCRIAPMTDPDDPPVSTPVSPCELDVAWDGVKRLEVDAGGQTSVALAYTGFGLTTSVIPDDARREVACDATMKATGDQLRLDGLDCHATGGDSVDPESSALVDVPWKRVESCLQIDHSLFEQTSGACLAQLEKTREKNLN